MAPEPFGMEGVEAHGLLDPLDALFGPAQPGQDLALLDDDEVVVLFLFVGGVLLFFIFV